jgi:hypothetical protein
VVLGAAAAALVTHFDHGTGVSPLRARIVAIAEGQVGYRTDPSDTYCNKFSAYWNAGTDDCGNGNLDEEWCADFATWAWKEAGAAVDYQLAPGHLNANSASFYVWGTNHGTWHPVGSGYAPEPGDVALYGLDTTAVTAVHVAVVTADGGSAPDVINGDGDRTGYSVVEVGDRQAYADVKGKGAPLSGYVSPTSPAASSTSS